MKKMKLAGYFGMTILAATLLFSCEDDKTATDTDNVTEGGKTLTGNYDQDVILKANETYYVEGDAIFKEGTTLTIEEGVTIEGKSEFISYILIEQGAQIMAKGTAENPIVMTADVKKAGSWGGLHICGKAPINVTGGTGESEIGGAIYGGTDAADNSGSIKYVRLEYTGVALDDEHESNGISFYGVGSGTTIDYVQIYEGADDGIEFFGGTVNIKHVLSTHSQDDSFDWTEGWSGKGQYLIAVQGTVGDRGIEGDNNGSNNTATPYASPILSQFTLIGAGDEGNYGMKLREGTKGKFVNFIVTGFDKRSIHVEHNQTMLNVIDGSLDVDYAKVSSDVSDAAIKYSVSKIANPDYDPNNPDSEEEIDDPNGVKPVDTEKFEASSNVLVESFSANASTQFDGGMDASTLSSFFTADSKIGAGNTWADGWTK